MIVPGKLGLADEGVGLPCQSTGDLLGRSTIGNRHLAAADGDHVGRDRDADGRGEAVDPVGVHGKPAAGVEQVGGVVTDRGQLQALHRTFVGGVEDAFVLEGHGGRGILGQAGGQGDAHGRVLGNALGRERLARGVGDLGEAQGVVQLEGRDAEVVEGGELHHGAGADLMAVRIQVGVNLVVVDAQAGFLHRPGRQRYDEQQKSEA